MNRTTLGILIILVGAILLLENIGPDIGIGNVSFGDLWPLVLVVYGIATMLESSRRHESGMLWGAIVTVIGLAFLSDNLFHFDVWDEFGNLVGDFWPLILIAFGGYVLLRERRR